MSPGSANLWLDMPTDASSMSCASILNKSRSMTESSIISFGTSASSCLNHLLTRSWRWSVPPGSSFARRIAPVDSMMCTDDMIANACVGGDRSFEGRGGGGALAPSRAGSSATFPSSTRLWNFSAET